MKYQIVTSDSLIVLASNFDTWTDASNERAFLSSKRALKGDHSTLLIEPYDPETGEEIIYPDMPELEEDFNLS